MNTSTNRTLHDIVTDILVAYLENNAAPTTGFRSGEHVGNWLGEVYVALLTKVIAAQQKP